jgi:hypothetical protein
MVFDLPFALELCGSVLVLLCGVFLIAWSGAFRTGLEIAPLLSLVGLVLLGFVLLEHVPALLGRCGTDEAQG